MSAKTNNPSHHNARKVMLRSYGLDWLTMTFELDAMQTVVDVLDPYLFDLEREGNISTHERVFGYGGMRTEKVFVGERDDGGIVVLPSYHADVLFRTIYPHCKNVSRIDLEVTVSPPSGPLSEADTEYWQSVGQTAYEVAVEKCKKCAISKMESANSGFTLYAGKRISKQYGRLYHKAAHPDSGPEWPKFSWRLEVEYKTPVARDVASHLYSLDPNEKRKVILSTVSDWFEARSIKAPHFYPGDLAFRPVVQKHQTTLEDKLAWLARSVRPTVRQLRENGYATECLRALGYSLLPHVPHETTEAHMEALERYEP